MASSPLADSEGRLGPLGSENWIRLGCGLGWQAEVFGRSEFGVAVRRGGDGPVVVVDEVVASGAEGGEVGYVGGPVVGPEFDVVCVGGLGVGLAGDAAAVAGGEDEFLGVVGVAPGGSQGEVRPCGVEDGGQDFGVDDKASSRSAIESDPPQAASPTIMSVGDQQQARRGP